jgi:hypothetical protein
MDRLLSLPKEEIGLNSHLTSGLTVTTRAGLGRPPSLWLPRRERPGGMVDAGRLWQRWRTPQRAAASEVTAAVLANP